MAKNGHLIYNQIPLVLSIAATIIGVTLFIVRPDAQMQQDIALIKRDLSTFETNHLEHLKSDVAKNVEGIDENEQSIIDLERKIDRILYLLGDENFEWTTQP